jgi:hypothetical protein
MEQVKKNQDYKYGIISQFARENEYEMEEYGNCVIGENFLVLRNEDNKVISFMLTETTFDYSMWTCIYNDFET